MKNWKKTIGIILFVLLNAAVIAATAFSEFGNSENATELSKVELHALICSNSPSSFNNILRFLQFCGIIYVVLLSPTFQEVIPRGIY